MAKNKVILADTDDIQLTTQGAYPEPDELAFVAKVQSWWKEGTEATENWLKKEKSEHDFALGHQWETEDYDAIVESGRYPLVLNKTLGILMVVSGHERSNRMRVRYLPVEAGDTQKAEIWTEVARIVQEQGDIDFNKSDAFFDMLKGGRGFVHLRVCYDDNPDGDIVSDKVPPWELRVDPTHKQYDLSDARYVVWSKEVSLEELLVLWPEKAEQLLMAQQQALGTDIPIGTEYDVIGDDYGNLLNRNFDKITKKWQLREAWYWQVEQVGDYMVQNPMTGQWNPVMGEDQVRGLLMSYPQLQWKKEARYERKYYQAFVCGPLLLENNPSYMNFKGYPFIPVYGMYDYEEGRYVGMIYHLMDPQIEINKRRTQVLHIVNQAAKGGWIGSEGSFVDRDQWEKQSGLPGFIGEYQIDPGGDKPTQILPQPIPSAFVQLEQMGNEDLRDISGVNIELLGLGVKDTPGIVVTQRQRQAMVLLQNYYDNLRRSTKMLGRLLLSMMQQFYEGRVFEVLGQSVSISQDMTVGRYDLIAEEAPYSPNQKMETALKLKEVIQTALAVGVPVPPEVLDYMDLPETLVQKWKGFIQEKMQAAQQPDPQIQLQFKKLEIDMRDQVRKEIDSYFKNMGIVAEAEAKEAGSQMQYYQSVVDQAMRQQELEQQQAQLQQQQAQVTQ